MDCSHKNMTNLPAQMLPKTEHLIMTGNNLQTLQNVDPSLRTLNKFSLQNSNIRFISDEALTIFTFKTDELNLSGNKLKQVSRKLHGTLNGTKLWLADNPFECNCDMMWMADWLQNASNVIDRYKIQCADGKWKGELLIFFLKLCLSVSEMMKNQFVFHQEQI